MPEPDTTAAHAKNRQLTVIIVLLVLLLVGGGIAFYLSIRRHDTTGSTAAAAGKVKLSQQPAYLALDPTFVVNFKDRDSMQRYLQVGMTLMSHDPAAIADAKQAMPVIRNALLLLLSAQDADALATPAGKRALQKQALSAVQGIIKAQLGRPGIEALYFTSFVMQ